VLRQSGGDVYDKWISHDIKFDSPEITKAMDTVAGWMKNDKYANAGIGNIATIATTAFQDGGKPILTNKCAMYQQASFYAAQWPTFKKDVKIAEDGDIFAFYLPSIDPAKKAVEGGGEFVTAFADDPATQAVQNYLSSPEWANSRIAVAPGWVSANEKVDQSLYTDPIDKISAKYLADPTATFRFDASDAMPAAVGSGTFWSGMVDWFGGKSAADVAKAIDASWPAS
jgi:alpha-glucoside transport system substrate-binding protein